MSRTAHMILLINNVPAVIPWSTQVAALNPVAGWKFNEASGTTLINYGSAGAALNGTFTPGAVAQTGQLGAQEAYSFADSSRVDVPNTAAHNPLTAFTRIFLVKAHTASFGALYVWGASIANGGMTFGSSLSSITAIVDTSGTNASLSTTVGLSADTWTLLFLTYDDTGDRKPRLYKYVSGAGLSECTYSSQVAGTGTLVNVNSGFHYWIGNRSSFDIPLDGLLDEHVVIPSVISTDQMTSLGASVFPGLTGGQTISSGDLSGTGDYSANGEFFSIEMVPHTTSTARAGIAACIDSASTPRNLIICSIGQVATGEYWIYIDKFVNDLYYSVASEPIVYVNNAKLRFEKEGSIVRGIYNGVQITSDVALTDGAIIHNTTHGYFSNNVGNTVSGLAVASNVSSYSLNGSSTSVFRLISRRDIFSHAAPNDHLARPVLTDLGNGVWVLAYRIATVHDGTGAGSINLHFSTDQGRTWTAANTFTDGSALTGAPFTAHSGASNTDAAEVILITCPNGDVLAHVWENPTAGGTYQYRSTAASGGKDWTDEGLINSDLRLRGAQDHFVKSGVIYCSIEICPTAIDRNTRPHNTSVISSNDNGVTWSEAVVYSGANDDSESSLCNTSGTKQLIIVRDVVALTTYKYTSTDGTTWSARSTLPVKVGVVQRSRMRAAYGGHIMWGRDTVASPTNREYNVIWWTPDDGVTWTRKFRADPEFYDDTAYWDILPRSDGTMYAVTYRGFNSTFANIEEIVLGVT